MYWAVRDDGPVYRVLPAVDGHWYVRPPLRGRHDESGRRGMAGVETDAFDVEAG